MLTIPGRIPIQIHPLFWIVVAAISLTNSRFDPLHSAIWALVICFSLIVHEFGHALTAVLFGQRASIELVGFGGLTRRQGKQLRPWQEFIIVFNGPLAGFLLSLTAFWLYQSYAERGSPLFDYVLGITYFANLFWTLVNLIPVQPLDGGQLMRIVMEGLFGLRGLKIALFLSFIISIVVSIALFLSKFLFAGSFFLLFAYEGYYAWKESLKITDNDINETLQSFLDIAKSEFQQKRYAQAVARLKVIRNQAKTGVLYTEATMLQARIYAIEERNEEAYALLKPYEKSLDDEMLKLLYDLAIKDNKWQEAINIGNKLYQQMPSNDIAVSNAICHSHLNEAIPAINWLKCAIRNGEKNKQDLLNQHYFDAIRNHPQFQKL